MSKENGLVLNTEPFEKMYTNTQSLEKWMKVKQLSSRADFDEAASTLNLVRDLADEAEKTKKNITAPINAGLRAFRAMTRRVTEPLERLDTHITELVRDYVRSEQELALRATKIKIAREVKKGNVEYAEDLKKHAKHAAIPSSSEIRLAEYWGAEVTNLPELLKAIVERHPQALISLVKIDTKVLTGLALIHKDKLKLPGVETKKHIRVCRNGHRDFGALTNADFAQLEEPGNE